MTLKDFHTLSPETQRKVVHDRGVFLSNRKGVGGTAILYQPGGFYVELLLDKESAVVLHLLSFDDMDRLEPYLCQIQLTEVQAWLGR